MKYLWREVYRCGCTLTERTRDRLPGFCPEHDNGRWLRSKIVAPQGFKESDLGLHAAELPEAPAQCQHQSNPLTCPFCEVLERNP